MGLKYLWDTNAVINYLRKNFDEIGQGLLSDIINNYQPAISVITEIELLCWKTNNVNDVAVLKNFISDCIIFELNQEIKFKTINIRKAYNLKLTDAIIAATADTNGFILISNDKKGFNKIGSLEIFIPA